MYSTADGFYKQPAPSQYTAAASKSMFFTPSTTFNEPPQQAFYTPTQPTVGSPSLEDEPPLLEELGIDLSAILQQTRFVMNPWASGIDSGAISDLTGPLVFIVTFAFSLLFGTGKHYFGYIYGYSTIGCLLMYSILKALAEPAAASISFTCTVSTLGYCILPIVALSLIWPFIKLFQLTLLGWLLAIIGIAWATYAASRILTLTMADTNKKGLRILVAYPCLLFYVVFALFVIF